MRKVAIALDPALEPVTAAERGALEVHEGRVCRVADADVQVLAVRRERHACDLAKEVDLLHVVEARRRIDDLRVTGGSWQRVRSAR